MIRIRQIKVNINKDNEDFIKDKVSHLLHIKKEEIKEFKINKKAIDARDKNNIHYVYEVDIRVDNENSVLVKNNAKDIFLVKNEEFNWQIESNKKRDNIIIVGSGPAGLFAAYFLVINGFRPIIIERGKNIVERVKDVELFWEKGILNEESNVQFGEGGAGTFSDGKLNTLIKDKEHIGKFVLEVFVKFGAPKEILYINNPHIGTDILRDVIVNLRNFIIDKGGVFKYETKLTDLIIADNKLKGIIVNDEEEILCDNLILAIGHSARDTFKMLNKRDILMEAKAFAVGVRVMHPQEMIDKNQYGNEAKNLPVANYKLTYTTSKNRGVYTFCMCPGGYVVNASSEKNRLAINGMSNYKRDSGIANSAVIVTINKNDFGNDALDGLEFQKNLEEAAYNLGKGNMPLQLWKDYQNNKVSEKLGEIKPALKGNYTFSNLRELYPNYINEALMEAIPNFGKKIKGFDKDDMILVGVESRTSSPIRILRDEYLEANIKGIYPCGEGAGYAGGITSSAIDGIKVARSLIIK